MEYRNFATSKLFSVAPSLPNDMIDRLNVSIGLKEFCRALKSLVGRENITKEFAYCAMKLGLDNTSFPLHPVRTSKPGTTDLHELLANFSSYAVYFVIAFSCILVVALLGNITVLIWMQKFYKEKTPSNIFILSFVVSDLLLSITCVPLEIKLMIFTGAWMLGDFACSLMPFVTNLTLFVNSFTLCILTADRYAVVMRANHVELIKTQAGVALTLFAIWFLSICGSVPVVMQYKLVEFDTGKMRNGTTSALVTHQRLCMLKREDNRGILSSWIIIGRVTIFVLCTLVMIVCYVRMCRKLCASRSNVISKYKSRKRRTKAEVHRMRQRFRIVITLIAFLLCFVGCRSPLILYHIMPKIIDLDNLITPEMYLILNYSFQCLTLSNPCWNPMIHAFGNRDILQNICFRNNTTQRTQARSIRFLRTADGLDHEAHIYLRGFSYSAQNSPSPEPYTTRSRATTASETLSDVGPNFPPSSPRMCEISSPKLHHVYLTVDDNKCHCILKKDCVGPPHID